MDTRTTPRRQFVLRTATHVDRLTEHIAQYWQDAAEGGHPLQVDIRPEDATRSGQQNRYYWAMLHQIADNAWVEGRQYHAEVWHDYFARRFIGVVDTPDGSRMAMSTAALTVREFADYVSNVEACAATELGITLVVDIPWG